MFSMPIWQSYNYFNHLRCPQNLEDSSKYQAWISTSHFEPKPSKNTWSGTMQPSFDSPHRWWHHDMWYLHRSNASSKLTVNKASVNQSINQIKSKSNSNQINQSINQSVRAHNSPSEGLGRSVDCRIMPAFCQKILDHPFIKQWTPNVSVALDDTRTLADWKTGKRKWMNFRLAHPHPQ